MYERPPSSGRSDFCRDLSPFFRKREGDAVQCLAERERLEAACERALAINAISYSVSVKAMPFSVWLDNSRA
jgi:hypothetical protein